MARRKHAIEVPGLGHSGQPFPVATRVGAVVASSALHGTDPETGELPDTVAGQVEGVFANVCRVVEAAGGTPADIVKVTVFAATPEVRPALNGPWCALFPDADDRPVRHTMQLDLPGSLLVQAEFLAVLEGGIP